jgi:hypothetical protein
VVVAAHRGARQKEPNSQTGYNFVPAELVGFVLPDLDNGNFADQNGDGWGCYRVNQGQSAKHGESSFTWKDNTNPLPEV